MEESLSIGIEVCLEGGGGVCVTAGPCIGEGFPENEQSNAMLGLINVAAS